MEIEDINSVVMSNERLLFLETGEIANLREAITYLWQLEQTLGPTASTAVVQRTLNLSAPLDSVLILENLKLVLSREIICNAIRHALLAVVRPAVLFLALLLELLALVAIVRCRCTCCGSESAAKAPSVLYLYFVFHVAALAIENTFFHGTEWLAYELGIGHPATAHRLLCSLWWLGFKVIHAFPLWILVPATIRAGNCVNFKCD